MDRKNFWIKTYCDAYAATHNTSMASQASLSALSDYDSIFSNEIKAEPYHGPLFCIHSNSLDIFCEKCSEALHDKRLRVVEVRV